jgi:hypothetical protein
MKFYCFHCEEMVDSFTDQFHTYPKWMDEDLQEEMFCDGPLYTSAPPELDMSDEWVDSLIDPSEDELILMDMDAEMLLSDFGVSE